MKKIGFYKFAGTLFYQYFYYFSRKNTSHWDGVLLVPRTKTMTSLVIFKELKTRFEITFLCSTIETCADLSIFCHRNRDQFFHHPVSATIVN